MREGKGRGREVGKELAPTYWVKFTPVGEGDTEEKSK